MGLHAYKYEEVHASDPTLIFDRPAPKKSGSGSKFKTSMERRVEQLWCEARELGWTYSQFVSVLLEVLVVVPQRDRLKASISKRRA